MYRPQGPSGKMVLGFVFSFLAGYSAALLLSTTLLPVREPWKLLEPHDWELKGIVAVASVISLFIGGSIGGMAGMQGAIIFGNRGLLHYFSSFLTGFAATYLICFAVGTKALGIEEAYGREMVLATLVSPIAGMIGNGIFAMICQMQEM